MVPTPARLITGSAHDPIVAIRAVRPVARGICWSDARSDRFAAGLSTPARLTRSDATTVPGMAAVATRAARLVTAEVRGSTPLRATFPAIRGSAAADLLAARQRVDEPSAPELADPDHESSGANVQRARTASAAASSERAADLPGAEAAAGRGLAEDSGCTGTARR